MKAWSGICVAVSLVACGGTLQSAQTVPGADAEAGQSLEQFFRDGMAQMDAGSTAFLKEHACPDAVMWDLDEKGAPVLAKGKEQVQATLDSYQKMFDEGARPTSTITSIECKATSAFGYCVIEMDQAMTVNGQTMGPMKMRGTLIADRDDGKWIWTHWHASMREVPAMAAMSGMPEAAPPVQ